MSKVFVVQQPHFWDFEEKRLKPKFTLEKAEKYGRIVVLLEPKVSPGDWDRILPSLKEKMLGMSYDDYFLPVGNPLLIGMTMHLAFKACHDELQLLQWNSRDAEYAPFTIRMS